MRSLKVMMLMCVLFICGALSAYAAEEINKKPLDEVFDQMVIVPYDLQGKAYINGLKTDLFEDYQMVQRNGRVLVPIRLMGYLATEAGQGKGSWNTSWQPEKPLEVVLTHTEWNRTIKLTANSRTMLVNNQPHVLDVAPQLIQGRILLPLRSTAEALDKKIEWLNGLILISNEYVDLQAPRTLAIQGKIKAELSDPRKPVEYDRAIVPITKVGDTVYYYKQIYTEKDVIDELYKKTGEQKEVKVQLPGKLHLSYSKIAAGELFYVSRVDEQWALYAFQFSDNKARKISSLDHWTPDFGWLGDIQYMDDELYITLHVGDNTMGGDTIYKHDKGTLKEVSSAKSFISFKKEGAYLYQSDFRFMSDMVNNLSRINIETGETTAIGEQGFVYGIHRELKEDGSSYYSYGSPLYIEDGYLYTIGYLESDLKDVSSVYRINLEDQTQMKLTPPSHEFWLLDHTLYYINSSTGYLESVDLDGSHPRTLVQREVKQVQMVQDQIYYMEKRNDDFYSTGELYRYDLASKKEVKLSDKAVSSFYVGETGIYYVSNGYDLGLYKVDANGRNVSLVKDSLSMAFLTDAGMVYTLKYKEGIYSVK